MPKESLPVEQPDLLKEKPAAPPAETPLAEAFDQRSLESVAPEIEKVLSNLEKHKPTIEHAPKEEEMHGVPEALYAVKNTGSGKPREQWEVERDAKTVTGYASWTRDVLIVLGTAFTGMSVVNGTLAFTAAAVGTSLAGYALLAAVAYYGVKAVGNFFNSHKK